MLDRTRVLGPDHPDTLSWATNPAIDLAAAGEHEQARDLDQDTLACSRRVLGEDHSATLSLASDLAIDLAALGEQSRRCWWACCGRFWTVSAGTGWAAGPGF
ncbi:MAG: tetratricopeptide repeat protein [Pseudonocardiales bacterium]|nr:tetratricopeptide repeat protein [Pseudonocardiales bacterium]